MKCLADLERAVRKVGGGHCPVRQTIRHRWQEVRRWTLVATPALLPATSAVWSDVTFGTPPGASCAEAPDGGTVVGDPMGRASISLTAADRATMQGANHPTVTPGKELLNCLHRQVDSNSIRKVEV